MGIFNFEQASESARKEAKSDVIVTSSPERVPDRSPGPFLCALMGFTVSFEGSRVIINTRAGEPENLKGWLRPFCCYDAWVINEGLGIKDLPPILSLCAYALGSLRYIIS